MGPGLGCEWENQGWSRELCGEPGWSGSELCRLFYDSILPTFLLSAARLGFNDAMVTTDLGLFGRYSYVMVA